MIPIHSYFRRSGYTQCICHIDLSSKRKAKTTSKVGMHHTRWTHYFLATTEWHQQKCCFHMLQKRSWQPKQNQSGHSNKKTWTIFCDQKRNAMVFLDRSAQVVVKIKIVFSFVRMTILSTAASDCMPSICRDNHPTCSKMYSHKHSVDRNAYHLRLFHYCSLELSPFDATI